MVNRSRRGAAHELIATTLVEMHDYLEERSESWQESDGAAAEMAITIAKRSQCWGIRGPTLPQRRRVKEYGSPE